MRLHLLPVSAAPNPDLFVPLREAFNRASDGILIGGFAFATVDGAQRLAEEMRDCRRWNVAPKRFVVGLHQAISEPAALELLRTMPESEVRVFLPGGRLSLRAIFGRPVFHAKVLGITAAKRGPVSFLQCGSANLTGAGIGESPRNYELSLAVTRQRR